MKPEPSAAQQPVPRAAAARLRASWWLPALAALLLAQGLRHGVIEPARIAHACDLAPWAGWCAARSLLILSFATQALGWLALAAGVAAIVARRRALVQLALTAGAAGLVLYCFEPSAVGILLGALAACRLPRRIG